MKSKKELLNIKTTIYINRSLEDEILSIASVKTGEKKYQTIEPLNINGELIPPETRLIEYIKNNTYPFIDINITFPQIDIEIYKKYFNREAEIKTHRQIQKNVEDAKSAIKKKLAINLF